MWASVACLHEAMQDSLRPATMFSLLSNGKLLLAHIQSFKLTISHKYAQPMWISDDHGLEGAVGGGVLRRPGRIPSVQLEVLG